MVVYLKMINLPTKKYLMKKYNLSYDELYNFMEKCFRWHLSEDELYEFILEDIMKKEMRINKRFVTP